MAKEIQMMHFSVELWVHECQSLEKSPILFYNAQGHIYDHAVLKETYFCLVVMNTFQRQMIKKILCHRCHRISYSVLFEGISQSRHELKKSSRELKISLRALFLRLQTKILKLRSMSLWEWR